MSEQGIVADQTSISCDREEGACVSDEVCYKLHRASRSYVTAFSALALPTVAVTLVEAS